jgi:hypothetical protein
MDKRGNIWWFGGNRGTGKSYEAEKTAESLQKRIIVYDWTDNESTYGHIAEINIADLDFRLKPNAKVRIKENDFDEFVEKCHNLRNTTIIIDDATAMFTGVIPQRLKELLYKAKNNRIEMMFQFHTITDTPPAFLKACNMFVIKATGDSFPLKNSAPYRQIIEPLIKDCITENRNYESGQKWATRLYDVNEEKIYTKIQGLKFKDSYKKFITVPEYMGNI